MSKSQAIRRIVELFEQNKAAYGPYPVPMNGEPEPCVQIPAAWLEALSQTMPKVL